MDPLKSSYLGLSGCSVGKNLPTNTGDARDAGVIPGSGRSPGVEHGNPLKNSCLENSMDRGAWWSMGLQRDPTERLSVCTSGRARTHTHTHTHTHRYTDTHRSPKESTLKSIGNSSNFSTSKGGIRNAHFKHIPYVILTNVVHGPHVEKHSMYHFTDGEIKAWRGKEQRLKITQRVRS